MESYIVLARKFRPQTFEEVNGQEHVTTTLKNAISSGRIAHAYLFSGPRGVGKTTLARLLAKSLNCEKGPSAKPCQVCSQCKEITAGSSIDVIEIDGASNRGIEQIREIRENVKFTPVNSKYKIYIIDEVHMLTEEAFNAFLKTLEEPPKYTVFVLATTNPQKIPQTILSRCQRFYLKRLSSEEIVNKLEFIIKQEDIQTEDEVLSLISRNVEGSMRDAISVLDQLISVSDKVVKLSDARLLLGIVNQHFLLKMTDCILHKDMKGALELLNALLTEGYDLHQFVKNWLEHIRNLVVVQVADKPQSLINLPQEDINNIKEQSRSFSKDYLLRMLKLVKDLDYELKFATQQRVIVEIKIAKLMEIDEVVEISQILKNLQALEKRLSGSDFKEDIAPVVIKDSGEKEEDIKPAESAGTISISGLEDANKVTKIKTLWPEVMSYIKSKKMTTWGLMGGSKVLGVDKETISIELQSKFHLENLEKQENKQIIEEAIKSVFNQSLKILWFVPKKDKDSEKDGKPHVTVKADEDGLDNDAVKKALKVFGGRLLDKNEKKQDWH